MNIRIPAPFRSCTVKTKTTYKVNFTASALGAALAIPLSATLPAVAQTAILEEIIVTAQRRDERSQDVPIAITTIGSDLIGQGDVQQLRDIAKLTPGLRFDNAGAVSQPTIRGVGSAVAVSGSTSNIGIYLDGFAVSNPYTMDFDLLNVESVQVLKGPQGTLFGRNSTGGAILVTTPEPDSEFGGKVEASYGSYNTQRYGAYITGAVAANLALDFGLLARKSDGFLDNKTSGSDTDGEYDSYTARIGAKWESETSALVFSYAHEERDERRLVAANAYEQDGQTNATADLFLPGSAAVEPKEVSNDYAPLIESESNILHLTYRTEIRGAQFTSLTQYRTDKTKNMMDFDFSSLPIFHFNFDVNDELFTQEFLLSSQGDGPLQWTTGLYYFHNDNEYKNNASAFGGGPFIKNGGSGTKTVAAAAFADLTYELTDNWFLTGGLRFSYDETEDAYYDTVDEMGTFTRNPVGGYDDTRATPRVVLRYTPTDSSSAYISYNQGYKAGIINVGGGGQVGLDVDAEEIEAYEIGYKYTGARMSFDGAAYYYDYTDLQVAYFDGPTSIIKNAGASSIYGIDLQARFAITEALNLNIGGSFIDAEYDDFKESQIWNQCLVAACGASFGIFVGATADVSGGGMARTPDFTGNIGGSYLLDLAGGNLILSGTYYYTSDFYFDSSELYYQSSYDLLSLRADWTDPSNVYTLSIFGDNVTDSEYRTQVLGQSFGGLSMWGAPATIGAAVKVNF